MKYPHTSSGKLLERLRVKIKLQRGTNEPIEIFYIWKASHQKKGGQYVNKEARRVEGRIVSSLLLTKIIFSITCSLKDDPQTLFAG